MNSQTFSSKLSAALVAGLVAITALAGCDDTPSPADSFQEGPTAQFRAQDTSEQMAEDSRFTALLDLSVDVAIQAVLQQQNMSEEDIDAMVRMLQHPDYAQNFAQSDLTLPELANAVGLPPDLLAAQGALIAELSAEFGLEGTQAAEVFEQAITSPTSRQYVNAGIQAQLEAKQIIKGNDGDDSTGGTGGTGDDGADTEGDCEDPCEAVLAEAIGDASVTLLASMASALTKGNWFLKVGGVIGASATYAAELARATRAHRECREECNGVDLTDECFFDGDCDADEYCFKGVLSIGKNQCRPLKGVGLGCARPSQCDTGCCKYHFGTNPFSKTCRPADRCE